MKFLKKFAIPLLIIVHILLIFFIRNNLYPIKYAQENFFLTFNFLVLLDLGNLIYIWLISKKIFGKFSLIPPAIYALIPWSSYLVSAESFYILLLFLLLVAFYIYISLKSKFLALVSVIPFLLGLLYILIGEIKIFSDPGLLNMVNEFQGAAREQGFGILARLSENKYLFGLEYIILKFLKHFSPSTYFTSQESLLNFSFSPPIYFGFLFPFFYGLYQALKDLNLRKILLISIILIIPSVLAKQMVDLNRLILFAPVIIFIISFGLIKLVELKKKLTVFIILFTLGLIIFQFLVTVSDISLREKARFVKYFGESYNLGQQ